MTSTGASPTAVVLTLYPASRNAEAMAVGAYGEYGARACQTRIIAYLIDASRSPCASHS